MIILIEWIVMLLVLAFLIWVFMNWVYPFFDTTKEFGWLNHKELNRRRTEKKAKKNQSQNPQP